MDMLVIISWTLLLVGKGAGPASKETPEPDPHHRRLSCSPPHAPTPSPSGAGGLRPRETRNPGIGPQHLPSEGRGPGGWPFQLVSYPCGPKQEPLPVNKPTRLQSPEGAGVARHISRTPPRAQAAAFLGSDIGRLGRGPKWY